MPVLRRAMKASRQTTSANPMAVGSSEELGLVIVNHG